MARRHFGRPDARLLRDRRLDAGPGIASSPRIDSTVADETERDATDIERHRQEQIAQEPAEASTSRKTARLPRWRPCGSRRAESSPAGEIASKLTPEHITQTLEMVNAQNERVLEDRKDGRRTTLRYVGIAAAAVLIAVGMLVFSGNAELLRTVGEWLVPASVGWAGGYGMGKSGADLTRYLTNYPVSKERIAKDQNREATRMTQAVPSGRQAVRRGRGRAVGRSVRDAAGLTTAIEGGGGGDRVLDGGGAPSAGAGLLGKLIRAADSLDGAGTPCPASQSTHTTHNGDGDAPQRLRRHGFHPNLIGVECPPRRRSSSGPPLLAQGSLAK